MLSWEVPLEENPQFPYVVANENLMSRKILTRPTEVLDTQHVLLTVAPSHQTSQMSPVQAEEEPLGQLHPLNERNS